MNSTTHRTSAERGAQLDANYQTTKLSNINAARRSGRIDKRDAASEQPVTTRYWSRPVDHMQSHSRGILSQNSNGRGKIAAPSPFVNLCCGDPHIGTEMRKSSCRDHHFGWLLYRSQFMDLIAPAREESYRATAPGQHLLRQSSGIVWVPGESLQSTLIQTHWPFEFQRFPLIVKRSGGERT